MNNDQLNILEHKVDQILFYIQTISGLRSSLYGSPEAVCPVCLNRVTYQPILDGTVKRICGCINPVHSIPVDNFKKKQE